MKLSNWILKPFLAIAIALPMLSTVNVSSANADHRYKRGAIIAGAIIGGAIAYRHYRKHRKHRHYGHGYGYRDPYYGRYYKGTRYYRKHYHGGYRHPRDTRHPAIRSGAAVK